MTATLAQTNLRDNANCTFYTRGMEHLPFALNAQFFALCLTLMLLGVVRYDLTRYIIPNSLNMAIFMLYLPAIYFLKLDAVSGLMAAGAVLLVGFGIFALGFMGGGDIKLLVALSLWTGFGEKLAYFLILTCLLGGVLSVVAIVLRAAFAPMWPKLFPTIAIPRILLRGEPVPYGIAIACAFLVLLWTGEVLAA